MRAPADGLEPIIAHLGELCREGRDRLDEAEGKALLGRLAIGVPRSVVLRGKAKVDVGVLDKLPGPRVWVKGLAPGLAHKTEIGALERVRKEPVEVAAAIGRIGNRMRRFGTPPSGFLVEEEVSTEVELLVSLHWNREMGPILAIGPGGQSAEALDQSLSEKAGTAFLSPTVRRPIEELLEGRWMEQPLLRPLRSTGPLTTPARLEELVEGLFHLARRAMPAELLELEINPIGVRGGELVALDAVVRLGDGAEVPSRPRRSRAVVGRVLAPRTIAVVGVSQRQNAGRTLLRNLLNGGFSPDRIVVVKPGLEEIDGCRCVADLGDLEEPVDLCVVSLGAGPSVDLVEDVAASGTARSLLLVAGGIGESEHGCDLSARLDTALAQARHERGSEALVLHGPNCLGVRSRPDLLDTSFVPAAKRELPDSVAGWSPWALLSQSGALALSRSARWREIPPRYEVTVGNQQDLTLGDYLVWMAGDPGVRLAAIYAEGLAALDGPRLLEGIQSFTRTGRPVVLYRAGRSTSGIEAGASHTAALAGERRVVVETARAAGALIAESLEEFEDLVRVLLHLEGRPVRSGRVGLVSNAGFECVAMADRLVDLQLATFGPETRRRIAHALESAGLETIVGIRNPLDLTPMMGDGGYGAAVEAVLDDSEVDVGVVGCVPFTDALRTMPEEGMGEPGSIARRLVGLVDHPTPWLSVVDAGRLYDPLADVIAEAGLPVFRTGDRAVQVLDRAVAWRLRWGRGV